MRRLDGRCISTKPHAFHQTLPPDAVGFCHTGFCHTAAVSQPPSSVVFRQWPNPTRTSRADPGLLSLRAAPSSPRGSLWSSSRRTPAQPGEGAGWSLRRAPASVEGGFAGADSRPPRRREAPLEAQVGRAGHAALFRLTSAKLDGLCLGLLEQTSDPQRQARCRVTDELRTGASRLRDPTREDY